MNVICTTLLGPYFLQRQSETPSRAKDSVKELEKMFKKKFWFFIIIFTLWDFRTTTILFLTEFSTFFFFFIKLPVYITWLLDSTFSILCYFHLPDFFILLNPKIFSISSVFSSLFFFPISYQSMLQFTTVFIVIINRCVGGCVLVIY